MTDVAKKPADPRPAAGNTAEDPDPFDVAALRLDQSFVDTAGVRKLLTTVPVRKPNPQDFSRVNPDPSYRDNFAVIELRDEREMYLVPPAIAQQLAGEFVTVTLYTAVNRQNVVYLWPVRLPSSDGKHNEWHRSAAEAAELAMTRWVRVKANMALGAYEITEAVSIMAEPEWPAAAFSELLRIGFRDRLVDRTDHPLIKRLHGLS